MTRLDSTHAPAPPLTDRVRQLVRPMDRKRLTRIALRNGGRKLLARRRVLRWWLIYGPARCGTTYMMLAIAENAKLKVSDWVLASALQLPPDVPEGRSRFDKARARRDTSRNILENARIGGGGPLDLVFKQAWLELDEYEALVEMWGEPERKIFCFREPSGYMASAVKKFPQLPVDLMQRRYNESFDLFWIIGGDAFEYTPQRTKADYISFLAPLVIPSTEQFDFHYSGSTADELVDPSMPEAYKAFLSRLQGGARGV